MEGTNYEDQAEEIAKFLQVWEVSFAKVDITGPGDPVLDNLRRRLSSTKCTLDGQRFSPQDNDRIYKQLDAELRHGRLLYPAADSREQRRFIEEHVGRPGAGPAVGLLHIIALTSRPTQAFLDA
jgi:hypothetical protein